MKKYLSLIFITILYLGFLSFPQVNALMACHTGNPNEFGNDIISLTQADCCEQFPEHNSTCSVNIGSCLDGATCYQFMDPTECNYEGGTWYDSNNCTNIQLPVNGCTIANGTGKKITNYGKHWAPYSEAGAIDLLWVPVCNPMPTQGDTCTNILDACKEDNVTPHYLECERYDLGTQSCVVDTCDTGFIKSGNECVAEPEAGVCSSTSQSCDTGNYLNLSDTSTEYKWQCSGLNGGQNTTCSLNIPVTPVAGECSTTHYGCNLGSVQNTVNGSVNWTWECAGTNGGTTVNCSENKNITPIPPIVVGNWPTNGATSLAYDETKVSNMSNESKYTLEWCSPHKIEINGTPNSECISKKFTNKGGIATLPINGGVDDLATVLNNMPFELVAEGVITLKTFAMDNANNITKKNFVFKIDKTAPKFGDFVFNEISGGEYINVENHSGNPSGLGINHVSTVTDGVSFPSISTYSDSIVKSTEKPYTQNLVQQIRYKQNGISPSPIINVSFSGATDTYGGTTHFNYVSRADKIEFYKGNTVTPYPGDYYEKIDIDLTSEINSQKQIDLETLDFSKSGSTPIGPDDGQYINVRLSDNAGNYSEKAFYVYRDETIPVVFGPSGFHFTFDDDDDLLLSDQKSKVILANNSTSIKYDWGTANDHMASNILIKTEKHDNPGDFQTATLANPSNGDTSSEPFNLSKVDNNISTGNYRDYSVVFETPGITGNKICDAVGNCVNGYDVFNGLRVMANVINNDKSNITITSPNHAIANNPANGGVDKYNLKYQLKDIFENTIRNVLLGGNTIKTVSTQLDFYNGLTGSLVSSGTLVNTDAVTLYGTEFSGNANLNNVVLKETNTNSDGEFTFEISSRVPTVGGYPYLNSSARLELIGATNNTVNSNVSQIHNPINENDTLTFQGTPVVYIDGNINENKSNRYNLDTSSITNYGKITAPLTYLDSLNASLNTTFNFEFASPFIYHATDFNILRDGIDSQHTKFIVDNGSTIGNYKILEKYFDVDNINSNIRVDFMIEGLIKNSFNELIGSAITDTFLVKYAAKSGMNFDTWGYVSYLGYDAGSLGGYTYIPSISRGIAATLVGNTTKASANFPNVTASGGVNFLTEDIAITGLINNIEGLANLNSQSGLASLDLDRPYTRAELLEKLKKKIFTVNKIGNWCSGTTTNLDETPGNHTSCTFDINGEIITFYEGNTTIDCGTTCDVDDKRTIIVKNGRVTINSNIQTNGGNGQFMVASITDKGLDNITISNGSDHELSAGKQKGWIAIDENVTNIDAFLLSQGPLVSSYLGDVMKNYSNTDRLLNQLHIYGSVFSLNTISGDKTNECPYIEQNCNNLDTAKVYDLSFLRRYTLVNSGNFNGTEGVDVPFSTDLDYTNTSTITTKSSGGYTYESDGSRSPLNTGLRTAKSEHVNAPVIIERDHRWTTNLSYFAKD